MKKTIGFAILCLLAVACGEKIDTPDDEMETKEQFAAVDLGLPSGLKWANMNLEATSQTEYGGYFAWGETASKTYFSTDGYKWYDTSKYRTKNDFNKGKTTLDLDDDAAHVLLGKKWRTPSQKDFDELIQNCNCTWGKQAGVSGLIVKSKKNGNSIFLPSGGVKNGHSTGAFEIGRYWTSNLLTEGPNYYAVVLQFTEVDTSVNSFPCDRGLLIRAVTE